MWPTEASKLFVHGSNAPFSGTRIWIATSQRTGLLWINNHGNNSPNPSESKPPVPGTNLLTALDPALGREIQKTRQALIVQNDVSNRVSDVTIVARSPRTSMSSHLQIEAQAVSATVALFNRIRGPACSLLMPINS